MSLHRPMFERRFPDFARQAFWNSERQMIWHNDEFVHIMTFIVWDGKFKPFTVCVTRKEMRLIVSIDIVSRTRIVSLIRRAGVEDDFHMHYRWTDPDQQSYWNALQEINLMEDEDVNVLYAEVFAALDSCNVNRSLDFDLSQEEMYL